MGYSYEPTPQNHQPDIVYWGVLIAIVMLLIGIKTGLENTKQKNMNNNYISISTDTYKTK